MAHERLVRTARTLKAKARGSKALPALLLVTDPRRTPDIADLMLRLPRGAGVLYRPFGAPDAVADGRRLAALARRRGLLLLAGADPRLALAIGAHGVHLPERLAHRAASVRRAHPRWIVTAAAHGAVALRRARAAHAALLSPAFPSRSPSAGRPLGPIRFAILSRHAAAPVYALGGVNVKTAPRLVGTGAVGIAAVEAFGL